MAAGTTISVEEYLKDTSKPYAEYLDGEIRRKPTPTYLHSMIEFLLVLLLRKQGVDAMHEVRVNLNPNRFLVPDVIAADALPDSYPTEPVTLCVEILSPEDRLSAVFAKCEEYHAWGVPYCWVIDPVKQIAWQYDAQGGLGTIGAGGTLSAGKRTVNLGDLFKTQA